MASESINIRPGVNILSVLPHLNYKAWYAIAEFVDNALQSFLANRKLLQRLEGRKFALQVDIVFDPNDKEIIVRDNAAGIAGPDYARAFRAAEVPPDANGLSEFGMGMKSAACWFSRKWSVRSSALGETVERLVTFDIDKIIRAKTESLPVSVRPAKNYQHFTEIRLHEIAKFPKTNTTAKIQEHLADIYRMFLRDGRLRLFFNGDQLTYEEPDVLVAPFYMNEDGPNRKWKIEFDFTLSGGKRAHGFAALRATASTSRAGFALFRRQRLIQGSADEGYRPEQIFGRSNSYAYQRVFGEITLEGFPVSHTKDGFQWGDSEDEFLEKLEKQLSSKSFPLLQQANGFRAKRHAARAKEAEVALSNTAAAIANRAPAVLVGLSDGIEAGTPPTLPAAKGLATKLVKLRLDGEDWEISIELSYDPAISDWLSVSDRELIGSSKARRLGLRLSMAHPFMERFGGTGTDEIEGLLRVAAALGLAEVRARDSGLKKAGTIRRNVNQLLREALSKP